MTAEKREFQGGLPQEYIDQLQSLRESLDPNKNKGDTLLKYYAAEGLINVAQKVGVPIEQAEADIGEIAGWREVEAVRDIMAMREAEQTGGVIFRRRGIQRGEKI